MTSMPASRRARAITFAPRSWPSRPGFATSTRIFCSGGIVFAETKHGANFLGYNREGQSVAPGSCPPFGPAGTAALHRLYIQTSPQIPAGDAAIGLPAFGDLLHLHGLGQLALVVMLFDRHLDAEIACRQYVWPLQREHQKHMRGPNADAFDLGQMCYHLFVGHLRQTSEVELTTNGPLRHVAQIRRFLFGEADRPHLLIG